MEQRQALKHRTLVGAGGGLVGIVAYDTIRLVMVKVFHYRFWPFDILRIFGQALIGPNASHVMQTAAGVLFHATNGIAFGIAFVMICRRPTIWWGILWGLFLECCMVSLYPGWLHVKFMQEFLSVSIVGHLAFGLTLGGIAQRYLSRGIGGGRSMNAEAPTRLDRLNDAFWLRLPVAVRRVFPGLSMILTDGLYVSAWPQAGGSTPLLAGFIGFFAGALFLIPSTNTVPLYSSSWLMMGVLIAVSTLGAALGVWLFAGYVLGDLCVLRLLRVLGTDAQISKHGWEDVGYLAVVYTLLAVLLISVPFVSHRLRQLAVFLPGELWNLALASYRKRGAAIPGFLLAVEKAAASTRAGYKKWLRFPFDVALHAMLTGLLIYFWTQTTPILLRSAYIWYAYPSLSFSVDTNQITLLQNGYAPLVGTGIVCGIIRITLEYIASGRSDFLGQVKVLRARMRDVRVNQNGALAWTGEIARIITATLLLYGILEQPANVIITALVLLVSTFTRKVILPRVTAWRDLITAVPLILRIAVIVGGSYLISGAMMQNSLNSANFYPVLLPLWTCLLLGMFFFPDQSGPATSNASEKPSAGVNSALKRGIWTIVLLACLTSAAYASDCNGVSDCMGLVGVWAAIIGGLIIAGIVLWWAWPAIAGLLAASGEGVAIAGAETIDAEVTEALAKIEEETAAGETVTVKWRRKANRLYALCTVWKHWNAIPASAKFKKCLHKRSLTP